MNMFELESRTFFDGGNNLGHAVIIMNRNKHISKFENILFSTKEFWMCYLCKQWK